MGAGPRPLLFVNIASVRPYGQRKYLNMAKLTVIIDPSFITVGKHVKRFNFKAVNWFKNSKQDGHNLIYETNCPKK
jgi:hypothetical protein